MKALKSNGLRNLIFGAEDSLVSTLGLLFGLASTSQFTKSQIFITGFIAISVEALSMGTGSFLSESSTQEVYSKERFSPRIDGVIMFFSYFLFGFVPLLPYLFFETRQAKYVSVVSSLIVLFALGYAPAKKLSSAVKMVVIAGLAAVLGFVLAYFFKV